MSLKITDFLDDYNHLLMNCDESYKDQFFDSLNKHLQAHYKLIGNSLENALKDIEEQYQQFNSQSNNKLSLKKFIAIASANSDRLRCNEFGPLVAGKLHELMIREGLFESTKITKAERVVKQKATALQSMLQSIHSEKEIRQFFNSNPIDINSNMKRTLRYLDCDTIRSYVRSGIIRTPETVELIDLITPNLMANFSAEQCIAFYRGLVEMKDHSRSFRQLFCMLINPSSRDNLEIILGHFPDEYFIKYLTENLNRIQSTKIAQHKFLALDGLIIQGRMQRAAQIVIRNAIHTGNFAEANRLLIYMQNRLGLNEVTCDLLTEEERRKFQSNSSVPITLKAKPDYLNQL